MRTRACLTVLVLLCGNLLAADTFKANLTGNKLSLNGGETRLGAEQWATPDESWRTVAELMKSALPPADAAGKRAGLTLVVDLDDAAPWGGLKALLMAAAAAGLPKAQVNVPGKPGAHVMLDLPGADPGTGEVVELPLFEGPDGNVQTENGGKKMACSQALMAGLVKQLPKATIYATAVPKLQAVKVLGILRALRDDARAAAVAYLPVKQLTPKETSDRKEAQDAVNRAFEGGLGGLGK